MIKPLVKSKISKMARCIFILVVLIISCNQSLLAQHDALVRYWNFDGEGSNNTIISNSVKDLKFVSGISGKGLDISDSDVFLEIKDGVDLMEDFTLSFWFNPKSIEPNQTLFYQFRQIPGDYFVKNFVRLEIENQEFLLKSEKGRFNLKSIDLTTNTWYYISYMFDGQNTKLYLQGKLIYSTDESISFYDKPGYRIKNRLFIGRSHTAKSQFQGTIDEVRVFQAAIKDSEVSAFFDEHRGNVNVAFADLQEPPAAQGVIISPTNGENENEIVFIESYEVLDPLIVRTTGVTLEYYQIKGNDETRLTITHNDKALDKAVVLSKEKQSLRIPLNLGSENSLTFEGFELKKNQNVIIRVNIKSGNDIIASYDINLNKNNVVLPIAYLREKDSNPKNHKIITVSSRNIQIQVKDNSKVDGDVITIKQEGNTILDNYMLTETLKNVDVELKENTQTEFAFVPNDMGKASGENTALVLVLVDGKVIYDFSLRSIDINRPARLTIIHEDF
ncbi:MAG: hypothetical protein HC803_06805 [Saprospiraceae bacterium]|nr:hypothetical protein [Saprospiraceae bacterium]